MLIALSLSGCLGASTALAEGFNPHAGNVSDACVFSFEGACEVSLKIPLTNQLGNFLEKLKKSECELFITNRLETINGKRNDGRIVKNDGLIEYHEDHSEYKKNLLIFHQQVRIFIDI